MLLHRGQFCCRCVMQILSPSFMYSPPLAPPSEREAAADASRDQEHIDRSTDPVAARTAALRERVSADGDFVEPVAVSAVEREQATDYAPAPVYAEIWKGGAKVAVVDIHGKVTSLSGMVVPADSGLSGSMLAAQRALEVARQVGGEIRSAGQALDGQTLLMRARLARTYLS